WRSEAGRRGRGAWRPNSTQAGPAGCRCLTAPGGPPIFRKRSDSPLTGSEVAMSPRRVMFDSIYRTSWTGLILVLGCARGGGGNDSHSDRLQKDVGEVVTTARNAQY